MRDSRRVWLRVFLPGRLWPGHREVRRSRPGGARRGHDRCRRLFRCGTGLRLPRIPGLRRGLPVRVRDGRSALYRTRYGPERLPVTRGNGAADPRDLRPWTIPSRGMNGRDGGAVDGFLLAYDGFDPGAEGLREALTSTGNGYLCTRGAAEWEDADGVHYPGTYVHGGYNRETTMMGGLPVLNEDLVNLPNWLVLKLRIEGEDAITLEDVELRHYRHEYDIRNATVLRRLRFRDRGGRETTLTSRRFVTMADPHHAAIEWTLVPVNWSGRVEVISALDARVSNRGVARYRKLEGRHLNPVSPRTFGPEVIALKAETRQSNLYISQATRTRVFRGGEPLPAERTLYQMEDYIQQVLAFDVRQGEATRVEKMIAFYTSRDPAVSDTLVRAARSAARHNDCSPPARRPCAATAR